MIKNEIEISEYYLNKTKEIKDTANNPIIDQVYNLAKGHYLKGSKRIIKRAEAQEIFEQMAEEEVLVHEITVDSMFNLCEMLIQELRQFGNEAVISEVKEVLEKLIKVAEDQNSFKVLVESKLLQSKVALLELDLKLAQETMQQAQQIAFERGHRSHQRQSLLVHPRADIGVGAVSGGLGRGALR